MDDPIKPLLRVKALEVALYKRLDLGMHNDIECCRMIMCSPLDQKPKQSGHPFICPIHPGCNLAPNADLKPAVGAAPQFWHVHVPRLGGRPAPNTWLGRGT